MDSFSAFAGLNLRGYVLAQIAIFVASLVFVLAKQILILPIFWFKSMFGVFLFCFKS
jgi:hypothetical protein